MVIIGSILLIILILALVASGILAMIGLGRWLARSAGVDDPPKQWWMWWWGYLIGFTLLGYGASLYEDMEGVLGADPGGYVLTFSMVCFLALSLIHIGFAIREVLYQIRKRRRFKEPSPMR